MSYVDFVLSADMKHELTRTLGNLIRTRNKAVMADQVVTDQFEKAIQQTCDRMGVTAPVLQSREQMGLAER